MSRTASHPTSAQRAAWHLSLLGHWALDVIRVAVGKAREKPGDALQVLVVVGLAALLLMPATTFTLRLTPVSGDRPLQQDGGVAADRAGIFGTATSGPATNEEAIVELIGRASGLAQTEAEALGMDAGVLLAAAAVAAPSEGPLNRAFGAALDEGYATPAQAWRAMSLSILAEAGNRRDRTALLDAAARLYPGSDRVRARLGYAVERYSL